MPKRPSTGSFIFSGVLIVVFAVAIIMALGYHGRAKVAPLVVAIPGITVVLVLLAQDLRAKAKLASSHSAEANEDEKKPKKGKEITTRSELIAFGWVTLLLVLLYFLGFVVAIPVYLFLYMRVKSKEKLRFSLAFAAVSSLVLYVFFIQILKMQLYPGLILELLMG